MFFPILIQFSESAMIWSEADRLFPILALYLPLSGNDVNN